MRKIHALERDSIESKEAARACKPQIAVVRLGEGGGASQRCALTWAPGGMARLLDGPIRAERRSTSAPKQYCKGEPPILTSNAVSSNHGTVLTS